MDQNLQLMFAYEDDEGIDNKVVIEYLKRRRELVVQIYEAVADLNLPIG